jgi:hypothetical protein
VAADMAASPAPVSATAELVVPEARSRVWQALAVLQPYCAVCDVSYVVTGSGARTTFVAVPGRLEGPPPAGSPAGTVTEWRPGRLVATRLELTPETWTTRIELADADAGGTRVTMTLTHEPVAGGRLARWVQRRARAELVRRTVDGELTKVPAHLAALSD